MTLQELLTRKSTLILRIEHAKASGDMDGVVTLSLEAATLELELANVFLERSATEDAVINLVSAGSCFIDALRHQDARDAFERALS